MAVFSDQERAATITNYLRQIEDNTMRNRALWGMMKQKGRISYNHGGRNFEWRIRMDELQARPYDGTTAPVFTTIDRYKVASLDYKALQIGEKLDKLILDRNKGPERIVDLFGDALERANQEFLRSTSKDLFNDGGSTTTRWDGLETFLGNTSTTGSSGKTKDPSDTYAGLSTVLGNYGGSWTGDWPDGNTTTGPIYDFFSPILVDTTATAWGASPAASFANYGEQQMRFAINRALKYRASQYGGDGDTMAMGDQTGMVLFTTEMKEDFQNLFSGTQRTMMEAVPKDFSFGYQVLNFDGWMLVHDFDVPANTGYGFLWSAIEYRSVYARLIEALKNQAGQERGFVVVPDGSGVIVGGWMHGNFKCNPRGFFKLYPYT